MSIEEQLTTYFRENFAADVDGDTALIESGLIDSMGVMELVEYLERSFGIEMDMDDMTVDRFGTITAIKQLITEKQEAM
ncbi:MAG TPA: acyl carrier protein [Geobacteraceae bacterium]|nr:acyl carrier protein [Geobacteraceae bacterium]